MPGDKPDAAAGRAIALPVHRHEDLASAITREYKPLVEAAREFVDAYKLGNETAEQLAACDDALREVAGEP